MQVNCKILASKKNYNISLSISMMEFKESGFDLGDSVNIYFDNGKKYMDVPYYNGFYTKKDELLLCAYPGYTTIDIARNQGSSIYLEAKVNSETKVTLELNEKHKYLAIQNALDLKMSNNHLDYESDYIFSNSRVVNYPEIKKDILYRSSSFITSTYKRNKYSELFFRENKVKNIICLAETKKQFDTYYQDHKSDYLTSVKEHLQFLNLEENYQDEKFIKKLGQALYKLSQSEGPYGITCIMGFNRTGFVIMLIMALLGCDKEELKQEYMYSYEYCYKIDEEKYHFIAEYKMSKYYAYFALFDENLQVAANKYLLK